MINEPITLEQAQTILADLLTVRTKLTSGKSWKYKDREWTSRDMAEVDDAIARYRKLVIDLDKAAQGIPATMVRVVGLKRR